MKPRFFESNSYLGLTETEKPFYLNPLSRSMHMDIVGSTGVGKTESVILSLILNDIINKRGVIFIDPKGDLATFKTISRMAALMGRTQDLVKFDLADPQGSSFYNPLKIGSASELKDKITGSIIWTEEYYKKASEKALLYIFNELETANVTATIPTISKLFNAKEEGTETIKKAPLEAREKLLALIKYVESKGEDLEGVRTDLYLWANSKFSPILEKEDGASALEWLETGKIVYINLNTLAFEDTARRFGRLVLQDIKTAVQQLQGKESIKRTSCSLYIDEFASIASSGFIELLNKARSAGLQITKAYQSLGDLKAVSTSFATQVVDNTNIKILFRMDDPESVDFFSKFGGTKKGFSITHQVKVGLFGKKRTGEGTMTETNSFILDPNIFRTLKRGQAFVISKNPYLISKVSFLPIEPRLKMVEEELKYGRSTWLKRLMDGFCWE